MVELSELVSGGRIRSITRWGEAVMHAPTIPVTVFDAELRTLVRDMFATMQAAEGVGLAATQVGDNRSLFIFQCPDADDHIQTGVVINPTVIVPEGRDRDLVSDDEGCLSLPGAFAVLSRPSQAICRGVDHNGDAVEIIGTGMLARCLQHEADHLTGSVFGDRLSNRARKSLYDEHEAKAYRYPPDWPISPKKAFDPAN